MMCPSSRCDTSQGYLTVAVESGGMSLDQEPPEFEKTHTWPDFAIGLYDRLTGRGATITYEFEDMEVDVPYRAGEDAEHAQWRLDGTLRVSTDDDE